jgi:hypothetical protein
MNPLTILSLLKDNWKLLAVIALAVLVWLHGDRNGAGRINAAWTADKLVKAEELQAAKDKAAADALAASQAHQDEVAAMKKTITQYERLVQYEIKKNYSSCVFTPELVSLWKKTFARGANSNQP